MSESMNVEGFRAGLRGSLMLPGDQGYDDARAVWNGMIDRSPALVVRAAGIADVVNCVNYARETGIPVSVKGGGHGVGGKAICDDGLLIDLSGMKDIRVDPQARTARVGGGATLGDVDHETQAFGLAVPAGIVSDTGVAGLTLGGGIGYQARRSGLTIDNLLGAEMVLADGTFVKVDENNRSDLFWAIRGGGGNFGVVTSFLYRLHELGPEVMTSLTYHDIDQAADILRFYDRFMSEADNGCAVYCLFANVPPAPHFPEERHGKPAAVLHACYAGPVEEGRKALSPLAEYGEPFFKAFGPMRFTDLQKAFDPGVPKGMRAYWKGANFEEISEEAVRIFSNAVRNIPGPLSLIGFEPLGGKVSEVDPAATAYAHRSANYSLGIWSGWHDPGEDEDNIAWTRELYEAMLPHSSEGVYFNYLDADDQSRVTSALGENYGRLKEIKAKYDPGNLFRSNMNIAP